jgi:DHA2 family multidrug resistance protein
VSTEATTVPDAISKVGAKAELGFWALAAGAFLAFLDIQITTSSIYPISAQLGITPSEGSAIQTAYLLAEILTIACTSFLTKVFSSRMVAVYAVFGFGTSSVLCALSANIEQLIVFRFIQGAFGGVLVPVSFSALYAIYPPEKHVTITTVVGSSIAITPTLGPFLGGIITQYLGWEWIFLVNVPPCIVIGWIVFRNVFIDKPSIGLLRKFDFSGFLSLATFLIMVEWALHKGPELGWLSSNDIKIMLLVMLAALFIFINRSLVSSFPIVDIMILKFGFFRLGCIFIFIQTFVHFGSMYIFPLFFAEVQGFSSEEIGYGLIIAGGFQLLSALFAPQILRLLGHQGTLALGLAILGASMLMNAQVNSEWSFAEFYLPMAMRGCAFMLMAVPIQIIAMSSMPKEHLSAAGSLFSLARNMGAAAAIAAIDTVIEMRTDNSLAEMAGEVSENSEYLEPIRSELLARGADGLVITDSAIVEFLQQLYIESLSQAFSDALNMLGMLTIIAFLLLILSLKPKAPST